MSDTAPPVPTDWKEEHWMAFVYLTFAVYTDGELAQEELETMATKLQEWGFVEDARATLAVAYGFWKGLNKDQTIALMASALHAMKSCFSPEVRTSIYKDLTAIAKADGKFAGCEQGWLEQMKKDLEV